MTTKTQIKNLFTKVLGSNIEVTSLENAEITEVYTKKRAFCDVIEQWSNAWKQQNTLFNKYGLDFSGYDNLLYGAIESLVYLQYGPIKHSVIVSFVYNKLNPEEDALSITDRNGKSYFVSNVNELFDFIENMKDEDFKFEDEK